MYPPSVGDTLFFVTAPVAQHDDVEELRRQLSLLARSVSHDLRAPLRAAKGFTLAVLDDHGAALPPEARESLTQVLTACDRMGAMLEGLGVVSRVLRAELRPEPVDVSELVASVRAELSSVHAGHPAQWDVEPGLRCSADRGLLRQAVRALLDNALKYSSRAQAPTIRVGRSEADGRAGFFVEDDGAGFDARYAQNLFQPFHRLHRVDEFPGLGLGLSVVRAVVGRHGGRVSADGAVGRGAVFRCHFPLGGSE
ncbi:ATP-binding protein [Myxococcota bacterium]|nr:ATP-binding protein [Myxococcota bacterium]